MYPKAIVFAIVLECVFGGRPLVKIRDGRIRGTEMQTFRGRTISAFYNIPYTKKLTYRSRFEELKDADAWEGVLDAGGPPISCPQVTLHNDIIGVENCLFVNVFTPFLPNSSFIEKLYPVVVYIHGGAYYFFYGGGYGPRYLLDKNVIYVSFNFRIGVPGFGSTEDHMLPGNLGLKDQLKALTWVQRNIHYFGGDRNSVTLLGMSSGAACVHLHYFSKKSIGLFHRGIILGGISTDMWAMNDRAKEKMERISENLGCPSNSSFDMIACLENLPVRELAMGPRTSQEIPPLIPLAPLSAHVDDFSPDPFLLDYPYSALAAGNVANLPLLVSNAEFEGVFPGAAMTEDKNLMRDIDENWLTRGKLILELDHVLDAFVNDTLMKIRRYYFGNEVISRNQEEQFLKMMSDRYYLTESVKTAILHARTNPRVYYYLFGYKAPQTTAEVVSKSPGRFGASHIGDLFFMFNVTDKLPLEKRPDDILMIERMTTMVASFAETGVPSFGTNVVFEPVERNASIYDPIRGLFIRSPRNMKMTRLNIGNVKFWDSLPIMELRRSSYFRSLNQS